MISSLTLIKSTVTGLDTSHLELLSRVTSETVVDTSSISETSSLLPSSPNQVNSFPITTKASSVTLTVSNKIWVSYNIMMLWLVLKSNMLLMTMSTDCKTQLIELTKYSIPFWKNSLQEISMKILTTTNVDGTPLLTIALSHMIVYSLAILFC